MSYHDYIDDCLAHDIEEPEPRSTTCRHCGKTDLNWEHDGDGWVLMEGRYRVHKCDLAVVHAQAAADFDDLDGSQ